MPFTRRPVRAASRLLVVSALGAALAGCGDAHARVTTDSAPDLIVLNGTLRTVKVFVVADEDIDVADLGDPLDEVGSGGVGTYDVTRGERTVILERRGRGHDPHRRARLHFRSGTCHVVILGPWPFPAYQRPARDIAADLVPPGTIVTFAPDPDGDLSN